MTRLVVVSAGVSDPSSTRMLADRVTGKALTALRHAGHDATASVVELARSSRPAMSTSTPT